ncbi:MAG: T9SS type A sorting domain-containing protein, partial [Candidatus Marinimicrobia bacterium]|nr:T9SS type A sorting domain-containing protein [Candidatus Neomarinimicrobiota bacterium]MBT4254135.1 T9SS type A sorting domain-containing protein [Candidatus Neomarinimicrobiota bacterium]MBT5785943.1 T9SS type A sorting domain-containing protein [Candidatus Neomarinimicrobiota bacterium]MBT6554296.1 T9SS type A sorting domain-containing protein [Candidatus Neomarinimicrobiota bacterium]MBT6719070.1 T9SS type A sorting domain-containing protein [Candidatus Neomarinimicrobiota bacterium]
DGDMDVLSASYYDDKIAWYENTQITGVGEVQTQPSNNRLAQNYPNPFNPSTRIAFEVQETSQVRLDIFDIQGRHIYTVLDKEMSVGHHDIVFNNHGLASGVYLYRIEMGDFVAARKMVISK